MHHMIDLFSYPEMVLISNVIEVLSGPYQFFYN